MIVKILAVAIIGYLIVMIIHTILHMVTERLPDTMRYSGLIGRSIKKKYEMDPKKPQGAGLVVSIGKNGGFYLSRNRICLWWLAITFYNFDADFILEYCADQIESIDFHPRAMKLIGKKKPFIVIANDEPYFETAYNLIRDREKLVGRWTDKDEQEYWALLITPIEESK